MKRILLAAALALASAASANAVEMLFKMPCSVVDRGHQRVYFDECNVDSAMSQGARGTVVTMPLAAAPWDRRRFSLQQTPSDPWFKWLIDGKPAKETIYVRPGARPMEHPASIVCYESRLVSLCSENGSAF